mmetsp:Transcript_35423/g.76596  ORF Transcript_35423/g.76596 Transcript_35423/m.76596 type:complete len:108 (+) Transcript_35423:624-947(+)
MARLHEDDRAYPPRILHADENSLSFKLVGVPDPFMTCCYEDDVAWTSLRGKRVFGLFVEAGIECKLTVYHTNSEPPLSWSFPAPTWSGPRFEASEDDPGTWGDCTIS